MLQKETCRIFAETLIGIVLINTLPSDTRLQGRRGTKGECKTHTAAMNYRDILVRINWLPMRRYLSCNKLLTPSEWPRAIIKYTFIIRMIILPFSAIISRAKLVAEYLSSHALILLTEPLEIVKTRRVYGDFFFSTVKKMKTHTYMHNERAEFYIFIIEKNAKYIRNIRLSSSSVTCARVSSLSITIFLRI